MTDTTRTVERETVEHRTEEVREHQCVICEQWVSDAEAVPIAVGSTAADTTAMSEQTTRVQAACPYCSEHVFGVAHADTGRVSVSRAAIAETTTSAAAWLLRAVLWATIVLWVVTVALPFLDIVVDILLSSPQPQEPVPLALLP
jgi:hypothetical protein